MAYTARPTGFLADLVQRIRDYTNEPEDNAKWTTDKLYPLIVSAWEKIMLDVNSTGDNPLVVRWDLTTTTTGQTYYLPANVGQILRFGRVESDGSVSDAVVPRSRLNPAGPGILFEGPIVRFEPQWGIGETLRVEYIPNGFCQLLYDSKQGSSNSTTAVEVGTSSAGAISVSEGYFDRRPNAYLGSIVNVISWAGTLSGVSAWSTYGFWPTQSRIVTGQTVGSGLLTVDPAFDLNLALGSAAAFGIEVVPFLGECFKEPLAWGVAATLHRAEKRKDAAELALSEYRELMRMIRLRQSWLNARTPGLFTGDTPGSGRFGVVEY